jgi:hypothetical protein
LPNKAVLVCRLLCQRQATAHTTPARTASHQVCQPSDGSWSLSMFSTKAVRPHRRLARGTVRSECPCDAGLFAIEILAQCPGGGWRTLSEWKTIFATAGYSLKDSKPVGSSMDMLIWQQDS